MNAKYHQEIMWRALAGRVSARALDAMTTANLGQDDWRGLLQPVFHFESPRWIDNEAYLETCRSQAVRAERPAQAWAAFGRLSHAAQDLYAHSNYVALWVEAHPAAGPKDIHSQEKAVLRHPRLRLDRVYWVREILWLAPLLRPLLRPLMPPDAHALVNLDGPEAGPLFPFALAAAIQRTRAEFEATLRAVPEPEDFVDGI